MNKNKGFTLIELLVVIAIIGVLSTIVIWALSSAKNKNADATVKEALSTIPSQAELFHADNNSRYVVNSTIYVCSPSSPRSIYPILLGAAHNVNLTSVVINNIPSGGNPLLTAKCNNSLDAWAAEVPLKNKKNIGGPGKSAMFCVDSTGFVGARSTSMGLNVTCPSS